MRVFICHKKRLVETIKGQEIERENVRAETLHAILKQTDHYVPWIDEANIPAGFEWERRIYHEILGSDVMILLLGPGTSQSVWVRREIGLALALDITILPLAFEMTRDDMARELAALGIERLQGMTTSNLKNNASEALLAELRDPLEQACEATRRQQREGPLRTVVTRHLLPAKTAANKQRAATFRLPVGDQACSLHVASGDMSKLTHVDVFVNSENDYMQMARFFESRTVSSMLRRRGARVSNGRYEDTIQQELDWNLKDRGRPVHVAEVFATSAGGKGSELSKFNKARYIFHVAAVQAVESEGKVVPYKESYQIESCVRNTLAKLGELNRAQGVVSPPGSEQRKEQEQRASQGTGAATSIVFPLFGTGQGGCEASEVIGPMLAGIRSQLEDKDNPDLARTVTDIYLSVYREKDVHAVIAYLQQHV